LLVYDIIKYKQDKPLFYYIPRDIAIGKDGARSFNDIANWCIPLLRGCAITNKSIVGIAQEEIMVY
jgi:hypothetical protein